MTNFLSQLSAASATIRGVAYPLNDYPLSYIDAYRFRLGDSVSEIALAVTEAGFDPDTAPDTPKPVLADWPASLVCKVAEDELPDSTDEELVAYLDESYPAMRFGEHIDLNLVHGFYCLPGNGFVTIKQRVDTGHLLDVLDGQDISISADGDICWPTSEYAGHYVVDGDEKVAWVFRDAQGPRVLTLDYNEGQEGPLYFLEVRFLNADDDRAFMAAFPEADA